MQTTTVDVGVPVTLRSWGDGRRRILFLHAMGPVSSGAMLDVSVQPLVDAGFQVIAPDLPGYGATPAGPVKSGTSLVHFLVRLNEAGSGREDRWESEEQPANCRSEAFGYEAGSNTNQSAECKAECKLAGLNAFQCAEFGLNHHRVIAEVTNHSAKEAANQTGISAMVVGSTRGLTRMRIQLTELA